MSDLDPNPATVVLDGALGIRTIGAVRTTLLTALSGRTALRIDCSGADSIDLSFIQLLLAARASARQAGIQLSLAAPAAGALRTALQQGGFLPQAGADPFWTGTA